LLGVRNKTDIKFGLPQRHKKSEAQARGVGAARGCLALCINTRLWPAALCWQGSRGDPTGGRNV